MIVLVFEVGQMAAEVPKAQRTLCTTGKESSSVAYAVALEGQGNCDTSGNGAITPLDAVYILQEGAD